MIVVDVSDNGIILFGCSMVTMVSPWGRPVCPLTPIDDSSTLEQTRETSECEFKLILLIAIKLMCGCR